MGYIILLFLVCGLLGRVTGKKQTFDSGSNHVPHFSDRKTERGDYICTICNGVHY